ncbi:MAG: hypothetical protein ACPGXK_04415 [Phycisphaerae bacterium]
MRLSQRFPQVGGLIDLPDDDPTETVPDFNVVGCVGAMGLVVVA